MRYKLVGTRIVSDSGPAPIRAAIEAHKAALGLFDASTNREIVGVAFAAGAQHWIDVWLPKRFTDYAKTLGYSVTEKYEAVKKKAYGQAIPLVLTGRTRMSVLEKSTFGVRNSSNKISIQINMPLPANDKGVVYGRYANSQVKQMLMTVPKLEIQRMSEVIYRALEEELTGRVSEKFGGTRDAQQGYSRQVPIGGKQRAKATGRS